MARARRSSSAARRGRSVRSRRSRRTARLPSACRSRVGSAASRPAPPTASWAAARRCRARAGRGDGRARRSRPGRRAAIRSGSRSRRSAAARRLRRRPAQPDGREPVAVALAARRPVVEADAVAQQQLAEPVAAAHQVDADGLARADEIAQRLLFATGNADGMQLAGQHQPDQQLGVAAVGPDTITGRPGDLARRCDDALHAASMQLAREPVPRRPGLVGRTHRARQPGAQPGRLHHVTGQREEPQLPGRGIEHRRHDLGGVHVQTDETSLAFVRAGFSYAIVGRRAG